MSEGVLIAGGSGAIGIQLAQFLYQKGFRVSILSRRKAIACEFKTFRWDIESNYIDTTCFDGVDHIIQLSGANIAEKRWTKSRKTELIASRVKSTNLLFETVKLNQIPLKSFISASAIGFYGAVTSEHVFNETDNAGTDFLADVCVQWERAANQFQSLGVRTCIIRTGIVLMPNEGAFAKLMLPAKLGIGSALGSGKQYFPWIHIADLCGIYQHCLAENNLNGIFNAVSPNSTSNYQFTKALCKTLNKPCIMPNIPAFVLKIALGELANTLITGSRVSSDKISKSKYLFKYPTLQSAISQLID